MGRRFVIMLYEEGASDLTYVNRVGSNYSLRRMVADANSAVRAITAFGDKAFVCDVCSKGRDIIDAELNEKAIRLPLKDLGPLCADGVHGAVLIGAHAMNSAPHAFGSYSINELAWQKYTVNDVEYGDIGLATIFFGNFNVPVIAISGDLAAIREGQTLIENLPGAIVKTSKIRNITDSALSSEKADTLIYNTVVHGLTILKDVKPYTVEPPYSIKVLYNRADYCDDAVRAYLSSGGLNRISALEAEKRLDKIVNFNDLRI